ncbi:MAG: thioredoxin family protein [Patescibacteria group bacterium]
MITKYGIMSSPGIIINGELFAMGGTTEKELRDKFEELRK